MSMEDNFFKENIMEKTTETTETIKPEETIEAPEQKEERESKISLIKETLETHFPKIVRVAEFALSKKGISISEEDKEKFRNLLTGTDELAIKILEIGGSFDKRVEAISGVLSPLLKKEIEIKKRESEGEEISKKQKIKEGLRVVVPDDREKDKEYMKKLANLFGELENVAGGKARLILLALNRILENEKVQEKISNEFRDWMNKDETEENAAGADDGINIENIEEEIAEIIKEFDFDLDGAIAAKL